MERRPVKRRTEKRRMKACLIKRALAFLLGMAVLAAGILPTAASAQEERHSGYAVTAEYDEASNTVSFNGNMEQVRGGVEVDEVTAPDGSTHAPADFSWQAERNGEYRFILSFKDVIQESADGGEPVKGNFREEFVLTADQIQEPETQTISEEPEEGAQADSEGETADAAQADGEGETADAAQADSEGETADAAQADGEGETADAAQTDGEGETADAAQADSEGETADAAQTDSTGEVRIVPMELEEFLEESTPAEEGTHTFAADLYETETAQLLEPGRTLEGGYAKDIIPEPSTITGDEGRHTKEGAALRVLVGGSEDKISDVAYINYFTNSPYGEGWFYALDEDDGDREYSQTMYRVNVDEGGKLTDVFRIYYPLASSGNNGKLSIDNTYNANEVPDKMQVYINGERLYHPAAKNKPEGGKTEIELPWNATVNVTLRYPDIYDSDSIKVQGRESSSGKMEQYTLEDSEDSEGYLSKEFSFVMPEKTNWYLLPEAKYGDMLWHNFGIIDLSHFNMETQVDTAAQYMDISWKVKSGAQRTSNSTSSTPTAVAEDGVTYANQVSKDFLKSNEKEENMSGGVSANNINAQTTILGRKYTDESGSLKVDFSYDKRNGNPSETGYDGPKSKSVRWESSLKMNMPASIFPRINAGWEDELRPGVGSFYKESDLTFEYAAVGVALKNKETAMGERVFMLEPSSSLTYTWWDGGKYMIRWLEDNGHTTDDGMEYNAGDAPTGDVVLDMSGMNLGESRTYHTPDGAEVTIKYKENRKQVFGSSSVNSRSKYGLMPYANTSGKTKYGAYSFEASNNMYFHYPVYEITVKGATNDFLLSTESENPTVRDINSVYDPDSIDKIQMGLFDLNQVPSEAEAEKEWLLKQEERDGSITLRPSQDKDYGWYVIPNGFSYQSGWTTGGSPKLQPYYRITVEEGMRPPNPVLKLYADNKAQTAGLGQSLAGHSLSYVTSALNGDGTISYYYKMKIESGKAADLSVNFSTEPMKVSGDYYRSPFDNQNEGTKIEGFYAPSLEGNTLKEGKQAKNISLLSDQVPKNALEEGKVFTGWKVELIGVKGDEKEKIADIKNGESDAFPLGARLDYHKLFHSHKDAVAAGGYDSLYIYVSPLQGDAATPGAVVEGKVGIKYQSSANTGTHGGFPEEGTGQQDSGAAAVDKFAGYTKIKEETHTVTANETPPTIAMKKTITGKEIKEKMPQAAEAQDTAIKDEDIYLLNESYDNTSKVTEDGGTIATYLYDRKVDVQFRLSEDGGVYELDGDYTTTEGNHNKVTLPEVEQVYNSLKGTGTAKDALSEEGAQESVLPDGVEESDYKERFKGWKIVLESGGTVTDSAGAYFGAPEEKKAAGGTKTGEDAGNTVVFDGYKGTDPEQYYAGSTGTVGKDTGEKDSFYQDAFKSGTVTFEAVFAGGGVTHTDASYGEKREDKEVYSGEEYTLKATFSYEGQTGKSEDAKEQTDIRKDLTDGLEVDLYKVENGSQAGAEKDKLYKWADIHGAAEGHEDELANTNFVPSAAKTGETGKNPYFITVDEAAGTFTVTYTVKGTTRERHEDTEFWILAYNSGNVPESEGSGISLDGMDKREAALEIRDYIPYKAEDIVVVPNPVKSADVTDENGSIVDGAEEDYDHLENPDLTIHAEENFTVSAVFKYDRDYYEYEAQKQSETTSADKSGAEKGLDGGEGVGTEGNVLPDGMKAALYKKNPVEGQNQAEPKYKLWATQTGPANEGWGDSWNQSGAKVKQPTYTDITPEEEGSMSKMEVSFEIINLDGSVSWQWDDEAQYCIYVWNESNGNMEPPKELPDSSGNTYITGSPCVNTKTVMQWKEAAAYVSVPANIQLDDSKGNAKNEQGVNVSSQYAGGSGVVKYLTDIGGSDLYNELPQIQVSVDDGTALVKNGAQTGNADRTADIYLMDGTRNTAKDDSDAGKVIIGYLDPDKNGTKKADNILLPQGKEVPFYVNTKRDYQKNGLYSAKLTYTLKILNPDGPE